MRIRGMAVKAHIGDFSWWPGKVKANFPRLPLITLLKQVTPRVGRWIESFTCIPTNHN